MYLLKTYIKVNIGPISILETNIFSTLQQNLKAHFEILL